MLFLACLFDSIGSYCCHSDVGICVGVGVGITLKSFMSKFFMLWPRHCQASYPVRGQVLLFLCQKLTMQLSSCSNAFWGKVYPFTMPGPPGGLLTIEKFLENNIRSHPLMGCDKTIIRIGISTQNKKTRILSKILQFSQQQQIQKMKLLDRKRTKKNLDRIVIVRTGIYL